MILKLEKVRCGHISKIRREETSPSLLQTYVQELFYSYWVPNETNALRNYTIYHRYPVSQEYKKMVDFISKLNLGHI